MRDDEVNSMQHLYFLGKSLKNPPIKVGLETKPESIFVLFHYSTQTKDNKTLEEDKLS